MVVVGECPVLKGLEREVQEDTLMVSKVYATQNGGNSRETLVEILAFPLTM